MRGERTSKNPTPTYHGMRVKISKNRVGFSRLHRNARQSSWHVFIYQRGRGGRRKELEILDYCLSVDVVEAGAKVGARPQNLPSPYRTRRRRRESIASVADENTPLRSLRTPRSVVDYQAPKLLWCASETTGEKQVVGAPRRCETQKKHLLEAINVSPVMAVRPAQQRFLPLRTARRLKGARHEPR